MATMRPIKIRNTKRAQWFFPFEVDEATAEIARGLPGLEVKRGERRRRKGNKVEVVEALICTLALGDAEADTARGEIAPELTIPGEVWAALMRDPVQSKAIRALVAKAEISTYNDLAA